MLLVLLLPLHKQKAEAAATPPKVYHVVGMVLPAPSSRPQKLA